MWLPPGNVGQEPFYCLLEINRPCINCDKASLERSDPKTTSVLNCACVVHPPRRSVCHLRLPNEGAKTY